MTYNGWANWETWNVALWIDNEEPLYRAKISFIRRTANLTAAKVKAFVLELLPNGTPDFDKDDKGYAAVDWDEIADNWRDE